MFVGDEVMLDVGSGVARGRLASLIRGSALLTASQEAYRDGLAVAFLPGPMGAVRGMSRLVRVRHQEPVHHHDPAVLVVLRWEAIGPGGLFPALDADMSLAGAGEATTSLRLEGAYRSPMSAVGTAPDRVIVHRVAAATIRGFLGRVGAAISDPARAPGAAGGDGRPEPAWRPPETEALVATQIGGPWVNGPGLAPEPARKTGR